MIVGKNLKLSGPPMIRPLRKRGFLEGFPEIAGCVILKEKALVLKVAEAHSFHGEVDKGIRDSRADW
jgi:hypothetical protein